MNRFLDFIVKWLLFWGIYYSVNGLWETLENLYYGNHTATPEDFIMGIILSVSLYCNLRSKLRIGGK